MIRRDMPSSMSSGPLNDRTNGTSYPRDFENTRTMLKPNGSVSRNSSQSSRTRKRWPPAPVVEDEETSLSREYPTTSNESPESRTQETRGSIDQMPILVEIGKEHEIEEVKPKSRKDKRRSNGKSLSDDSYDGPDTPNDSSASDSNDSRRRKPQKYYETPTASSIKAVLDGQRRPDLQKRSGSTKLPERPQSRLNPPSQPPSFHRSSSSRDIRSPQVSGHLYPGTLEELKSHPRDQEFLGYAQRQRTMSGSNNAADHRPANIRHMSAMGYSGESQTPSFPRDHPALHASPVSTTPMGLPPQFRQPRDKDHDAIVSSSSESEISPDEMYRRKSRQRTSSRSSSRSHSTASYSNPPRPPPKEPIKQYSRPSSPERRAGRTLAPSEILTKRPQEPHSPTARRSPFASSGTSPYASPPPSPASNSRPSSRPTSRDGPIKVGYPSASKKPQQSQKTSRPSSPIGGVSQNEHHTTSNLRYSSRPSSPVSQPSKDTSVQGVSKPEIQGARRDALKPGGIASRDPSPIQVPRSSRSPKPGLRVDVQQSEAVPALSKPRTDTNHELKPRPASGDGSMNAFASRVMSTVPMSAPLRPTNQSRPQPVLNNPLAAMKQAKSNKPRPQLIACPRRGFTANYADWWTISQISDLDLCPDCKQSLQDNGFEGTFVRGQTRPPGTRTRCDMNVSWVRIACLLILSGRGKLDMLIDVMDVLSTEEQCPAHQAGIRKKWYRVWDEDADHHISNFYACPACVQSVRVLFPNLKGTFNSQVTTSQHPKVCDLSASVPRFAKYVDLLDNISAEAKLYRKPPDIKKFIRMAKDFGGIQPCQRDDQFRGMPWHYIPHIPDFTICGECFMEVVRPAQRAGSDIADQINRKLLMPPDINMKLSCQLYSSRMRDIFEECCRNQDLNSLREHAMARVTKERQLQYRVESVNNLPEEMQEQEMQVLIAEWRRWE